MKFMKILHIISVSCLFLVGCFNRTPMPNPQPQDTILAQTEPEEEEYSGSFQEWNEDQEVENVDPNSYGNIYKEKDVRLAIYFEFDRSGLSQKQQEDLIVICDELNSHLESKVLLAGHCDWYGTEDYNMRLGNLRAQSVEEFLLSKGVKKQQIETMSLGSTCAHRNLSKEDAWKDRRCDIVVYPLTK